MLTTNQERHYRDGVCKPIIQTCGATSVAWRVDARDGTVYIDLGKYPDSASLTLIGPDADRLYEALGQALRERDLASSAEPSPVETGGGG